MHVTGSAGASAPSFAVLARGHAVAAAEVLAASHADDPAFSFVFPDAAARAHALRPFFAAVARDAAAFGTSTVASLDGSVVAVGIWLPPGAFPWSAARKLRSVPAMLGVLRAAPARFRVFSQLGANVERRHPPGEHWYLEVVGVRPEAQGGGLGSRLVEDGLARADRDGLPCYLETAKAENVRFYERFGFHVEDEALRLVPGGPTHWGMRRPSAGAPAGEP